MKRSIKWRFILPFGLILLTVVIAFLVFFTSQYRNHYYADIRVALTNQARLLAEEIALLPENTANQTYLSDLVQRFADNLDVRVTIIRVDGKVIAESDATAEMMVNHLNRPEVQMVIAGENGYNIRYSTTLKTDMVYVAVGQLKGDELVNIVRLAMPVEIVNTRIKMISRTIIGGGLAGMFLAVLVTYIAAKRTTTPINQLTAAAKRITSGDFSGIPEPGSDNEINDLTRAFSSMAAQLQEQINTISSQNTNLATIVDRLMDGLVIVNRYGTLVLVNKTARKWFGIHSIDLEGEKFVKVMQHYQLADLWQKTLEAGKDQSMIIDLKSQDKHLLGLSTFLGTVKEGTVLILLQDQTKARNLEEMRQTFVSNVSHELRTPLTTMKALVETLQQHLQDDPTSAERFLNLMDIEIDKLTQMVLELLELSRIESGRVEMRKEQVSVCEMINKPVNRMKTQAERAHLELRLDCPEGLPNIMVDIERMEQALINIIHNAIKYTAQGGLITVSVEHIDQEVIIRVKDTGTGIDPKDLPRIFERFYKTDQARAGGGTGLGLAIAKHIVEAHQGRIWVESQKGVGSIFSIALTIV